MKHATSLLAAITVVLASAAGAQQITPSEAYRPADPARFHKIPGYSPYAGRRYPTRPLFGDEHVHTGWSGDAGAGGTTLSPEEAFRFARGEEVVATSGQPAQLSRPLDWMAITDHSDGMGTIDMIRRGDPEMMADPTLKRWHDLIAQGGDGTRTAVMELIAAQSNKRLPALVMDPKFAKSAWESTTAIAEKYNEPGRFTALIGYEWTSNAGGGDNLHRNVIYRDGKARADQALPMTTFVSENPEELWRWMGEWERKTGGRLLAIPHNGNLSNGRMFELQTFDGKPLTKEWAAERASREPLFELIQFKGQSESHPSLSPNDEFAAGYELWERGNLNLVPKKPGMIQYEYFREALKNGLKVGRELGVNPFQYGSAAGTDTHNALAAAEEDNFFCKFAACEPRPDRWSEDTLKFGDRVVKGWEVTSAGYTAVWALENTREAIWDAMKRRETYATSGTRLVLRFFGGWGFEPGDLDARTPAIPGYTKGVPMGGELPKGPAGKAPTFLVAAVKDPYGGNLDRVQVIKGWVDKSGKTHEKVFDVAWSSPEKRKRGADGRIPVVGNTVDVAKANWTNTIGTPELGTIWTDPEFDPAVAAFYYARVIEIPTPRWTAYDAVRFKVKVAPEVPMITQERAWSSPIWYSPAK